MTQGQEYDRFELAPEDEDRANDPLSGDLRTGDLKPPVGGLPPERSYNILPEHMREGVRLYFEKHRRSGGFWMSIVNNDLIGAVQRGDTINQRILPIYVTWLIEFAPEDSYGSPENVRKWCLRVK